MPLRFRKSVKIVPGVRATVGKKSGSLSVGGGGTRYSASSSGRRTSTVGIPGTGLSSISSRTAGSRTRGGASSAGGVPYTVLLQGWFWTLVGIGALAAYAFLGGWLGVVIVAVGVVLVFVYERGRLSQPSESGQSDVDE